MRGAMLERVCGMVSDKFDFFFNTNSSSLLIHAEIRTLTAAGLMSDNPNNAPQCGLCEEILSGAVAHTCQECGVLCRSCAASHDKMKVVQSGTLRLR